MAEMTDRSFGYPCCPPPPPPHSCTPGHITAQDWMQYINAYMDVRARQIYDKIKGNQGEENVINQIKLNGNIQYPINKSVDLTVPTNASELPFDSSKTTKKVIDDISTEVDTIKSNVNIVTANVQDIKITMDDHIFDDTTGDYFILKDHNDPNKKYKVFIVDGTICSEEL